MPNALHTQGESVNLAFAAGMLGLSRPSALESDSTKSSMMEAIMLKSL